MQRTVGRHIRALDDDLPHLDRVLLPILQRLARERPPEAKPVLLGLREAVMQNRVRLRPEVRQLPGVSWNADMSWCAAGEPRGARPAQPAGGWFGRSGPGPA